MTLAWRPPDPDLPEPSWALVRALMARKSQPANRREAGLWAVDRLESYLGPDWAGLAFANDPSLRDLLVWSSAHVDAVLFVVELALRLEVLKQLPGFAKVRNQVTTDVRYALAGHAQLQLETAALAHHLGTKIGLEVQTPRASSPVDLCVAVGEAPMPVEVKVLFANDEFREITKVSDHLSMARMEISLRFHVSLQVTVDHVPHDIEAAVDFMERAAIASLLTADVVERKHDAVHVVAFPSDKPDRSSFAGPPIGGDAWARLGRALQEKADKRYADRPAWLRFDVRNSLWQLTPWAILPLADKAAMAAERVRSELNGYELAGVVLSSGCLRPQGPVDEDTWHASSDTASALRRRLPAGRARETIIVSIDRRYRDEACWWFDLYDVVEPAWLETNLGNFDLPAI